MKKFWMALCLAGTMFIQGFAMEQDSARVAPFHLSFITPLGTNGLESWNTVNHLSVNLFAGYSGGLKGVEVAGFANVLKGNMDGIQVAGFCNNTFGEAKGAEIAGYWNLNFKSVTGFQASGFANVALGHVDGFQATGFANYAKGVSVAQASGFANVSTGDASGVQATGFANVVTGTMRGVQASGFLNYARKLKGVQIGIVNYTDSLEAGIPIGLLSIVRNGYFALDLSASESLYAQISLKTGVRRFYNILSMGGATHRGDLHWGWGYGFGTLLPVANSLDLSIEGIAWYLNKNYWFTGYQTTLNRLQVAVNYQLNQRMSLYLGPSLNLWITNVNDSGDPFAEAPFDRLTIYQRTGHRVQYEIYPGLSAGINILINK